MTHDPVTVRLDSSIAEHTKAVADHLVWIEPGSAIVVDPQQDVESATRPTPR